MSRVYARDASEPIDVMLYLNGSSIFQQFEEKNAKCIQSVNDLYIHGTKVITQIHSVRQISFMAAVANSFRI